MLNNIIETALEESISENNRFENEITKIIKEVASISEIPVVCTLNFAEELLVYPYDKSISLLEKYKKENNTIGFINKVQENIKGYIDQAKSYQINTQMTTGSKNRYALSEENKFNS